MGKCDVCGNDYDKSFEMTKGGKTTTFDSFECAINALAPRCDHCEVRIIGHGLEADGKFYCCDHCAEKSGVEGLNDRVWLLHQAQMLVFVALLTQQAPSCWLRK